MHKLNQSLTIKNEETELNLSGMKEGLRQRDEILKVQGKNVIKLQDQLVETRVRLEDCERQLAAAKQQLVLDL